MNWMLFFLTPPAVLVGLVLCTALALWLFYFSGVPISRGRLATLPRRLFKVGVVLTATLWGLYFLIFFTVA